MLKVCLIGFGQMGNLIKNIATENNCEIVSIIDPNLNNEIDEESLKNCDVCIDFTAPDFVIENVNKIAKFQKNIVIGTTGWYSEIAKIREIAEENNIGIIYGSNFSLGMNMFFQIVEQTAQIMNNSKDYDVYSLRRTIGHVQQDIFIFYGTIKDNILYGNPDATNEEIIEAAKRAKIHEYILSLPNGYETYTGEKGVKLSGGQKQRIAIARLFLKKPKIVILDEATSSLDNVTERLIQSAFDDLVKEKTAIVIAHRLSTIMNADRIIVLGKDGILEMGSHQELIDLKGVYYNLLKQ